MRARMVLLGVALLLASALPVALSEDAGVAAEEGAGTVSPPPTPTTPKEPVEEHTADEGEGAPPPPPSPPPPPPSMGEEPLDLALVGGVVAAVLLGGVGVYFVLFSWERKPRFRGDAVFLIGPCGAGKTAIFFKLHAGEGGEKGLRATHTSMVKNEGKAELDGQQVRVVDYPGHLRLRPVLFSQLEDCCAVVFVIDSAAFVKQAKETAELMLDLMTSPALLKHASRMLVVCNKTDSMPDDLAGIQPRNLVRKRLETEIEALRASRKSGLGDTGNSDLVELEIEGNAFRWSDSPVEAEFIDYSAKNDTLSPIAKFVSSCKAG